MGPALIHTWRNLRHLVETCRGRAARGQAARPRQDSSRELRTLNDEARLSGVQSPQQHPDEVDGSFHRLYSKGQNGSALTHVDEQGHPLPTRDDEDPEMGLGSLRVTADSDTASEEIALKDMLAYTSVKEVDKH